MIIKKTVQKKYGKALGFKTKGGTKVFAIQYDGKNAYDVQEFLGQSIFIGPHYEFLKVDGRIIRKGGWIIKYPITLNKVTLKSKYSLCNNYIFEQNYTPWRGTCFINREGNIGTKRDNREIGTGKSKREKSKHSESYSKVQRKQDTPARDIQRSK